jgi:threonine aldolase
MYQPVMMTPIDFRSDNTAGAAPEILEALKKANTETAPAYGQDRWTLELQERVRELFANPHAQAFPVMSGTAANSLVLSAMCPPWGSILCHESAHILQSECNATSMFGGGASIRGLAGNGHLLTPESLQDAFKNTGWGDNHQSQPSVLSLTLPSDFGTSYTLDQISALSETAKQRGLSIHVDGARIANVLAGQKISPAQLVRSSGVSALSLGGVKNGTLSADAIVSFDPRISEQLHYRLKRAGHIASKMRFQSAQLIAYLQDDLWLRQAARANAAMARLSAGFMDMGWNVLHPCSVNMAFVQMDESFAQRLWDLGLLFHRHPTGWARFVTSFATRSEDVDEALRRASSLR